MTKPTIRRTYAERLLSCPQYAPEHSERLSFGIAFHDFVAAYWLECLATHHESRLTSVTTLATAAWARTLGLNQSRFPEYLGLCEKFATENLANLDTMLKIEAPIVVDVGWAFLTCRPDRIDRADAGDPDEPPRWLRVVDYKTEQGEMDHLFQVWWYAMSCFLRWPDVEGIDFEVYPVRLGRPWEPVRIRRGELDTWWNDVVLPALRDRLTVGGPVTGGVSCEDCRHRLVCAEATAVAQAIPETVGQADELFGRKLRLTGALGAVDGGLASFYRDRPWRPVLGHEVGFNLPRDPSPTVQVSPGRFAAWLRQQLVVGEKRATWRDYFSIAVHRLPAKIKRQGLEDGVLAEVPAGERVAKFTVRKHVPLREQREATRAAEE